MLTKHASLDGDPMVVVGIDDSFWNEDSEHEADSRLWVRALANTPLVYVSGRSIESARTLVRDFGLPCPDVYIVDSGASVAPGRLPADFSLLEAALHASWDGEHAIRARMDPLATMVEPQPWGTSHRVSYFVRPGVRATDAIGRMRSELRDCRASVLCADGAHVDVVPEGANRASTLARVRYWAGWHRRPLIAASAALADTDVLIAAEYPIVLASATVELRQALAHKNRVHLPKHPGFKGIAAGVRKALASTG